MEDEVQTYLLGLKYFTTGDWPFYGNDVLTPPPGPSMLLSQDPGALQALLVGIPLKIWPDPLSPLLAVNLLSFAAFSFLALYILKRLPNFSPWFVFPWVLTLPWTLHYSTGILNLSYTVTASCFFFVAFMESLPPLSLGWITPLRANLLMGFSLGAWVQLHRTWVLSVPFLLLSFYFQWKASRKPTTLLHFVLGALPMILLIVPTFFRPDYHYFRDIHGMSASFELRNLGRFFTILIQYLALVSFEMLRFIGISTQARTAYLASHWTLWTGFLLWYFSYLQAVILLGFGFDPKNPAKSWDWVRLMAGLTFLLIFGLLMFSAKNPDLNTFYETLPIMMVYSFCVMSRFWSWAPARKFLWVLLFSSLAFQTGYLFEKTPQKESFYSTYKDPIAKAIQEKNFHLLGERRPGTFY